MGRLEAYLLIDEDAEYEFFPNLEEARQSLQTLIEGGAAKNDLRLYKVESVPFEIKPLQVEVVI